MNEIILNGETYIKKDNIKAKVNIDINLIKNSLEDGTIDFYDLKLMLKDFLEEDLRDEGYITLDFGEINGNNSSEDLNNILLYRVLKDL